MVHCKQTLVAALMVVAVLVGCGDATQTGQGDDPGQTAFARYCAGCHGQQGQGRPPAFPPLAGSEWLSLPPEVPGAIILLGLRGEIEVAGQTYVGYMPPMRHIDDQGVAAIVRYIQRQWSQEAPDWTAKDAAALRAELAGRRTPEGRKGIERILEELQ
ncbi:MAG TPA: cytochrome c [Wenzhouxiangella sp.]|nr:cytochrome c [Wenzhouxiangella sp.]